MVEGQRKTHCGVEYVLAVNLLHASGDAVNTELFGKTDCILHVEAQRGKLDVEGKFLVEGLPNGIYDMTVKADGFLDAHVNVTVEGYLTYDTAEYLTTKETLEKALSEPLGGYFQTRFEDGQAHLDYLVKPTLLSPQTIEFGKNLIDLQRTEDGEDLFSAILPLGDEVDGARVQIGSVNNWNPFIVNQNAYNLCGYIAKVVTFDGITDPQKLKSAATLYLQENYIAASNIEITITDMSHIDSSYDSFKIGQNVEVISPKHFKEKMTFLIRKMTINVSDPTQTRITVGKVKQGFVESIT